VEIVSLQYPDGSFEYHLTVDLEEMEDTGIESQCLSTCMKAAHQVFGQFEIWDSPMFQFNFKALWDDMDITPDKEPELEGFLLELPRERAVFHLWLSTEIPRHIRVNEYRMVD